MKLSAFLAFLFLLTALSVHAAERIAFVVGVDTYENLPAEAQLKVAVSDAERMAETLESLDPPFSVTLLKDANWKSAQDQFDTFLDQAKNAECALVYFAGHGIEYHGANFLLVKDTDVADISSDVERMKRRLSTAALSLQGWVDSLDSTKAQVKLVILDCCRDNPLKAEDGSGSRSVVGGSRGLAQVTPPSGTLISYSADAGQQANDGLFTEVLTNNLKAPGLNIVKVFAKTREEVREISSAWADEDAAKGLDPRFRRPRHEPAEYNKLNLAGTDFAFTRGVPVKVKTEDSATKAEMAKLKEELAAALAKIAAADGNAAEMAKLQKELEEARTKMAAATTAPAVPSSAAIPTTPAPSQSTPVTMVKTDPAPAPAFPASRGMEGSKAGEVREFGGIEMVWCPPGEFLMGSPEDEVDRREDETQHRVKLTRGFWMAKTECTQPQWEGMTGENPSDFTGADLPVDYVSWDDVQVWLKKMNELYPLPLGWKWELPTEAQWEYACRAGTETAYSFGNTTSALSTYANFADKNFTTKFGSGDESQDDGVGNTTASVGKYKPNPWGICDMHGNVFEWCRDWYSVDFNNNEQDDPTGPVSGEYRVSRGGSWDNYPEDCRSAYRFPAMPDDHSFNPGFRPVAVPPAAVAATTAEGNGNSDPVPAISMAKIDPAPTPAFPSSPEMEGSLPGERRELAEDERKLLAEWTAKLAPEKLKDANLDNGRILFKATCSVCHVMNGEGSKMGPDLTGSNRHDLGYVLDNILYPSAVVSDNYRMNLLTMRDGSVHSGVVPIEDELTLTTSSFGIETVIEKKDITKREILPTSMMPSGLLLALDETQVRDLIAYLMHPAQMPQPQ
jgi:formylglycine-generating enzyme